MLYLGKSITFGTVYSTYQPDGIVVVAPDDERGEECAQVLTSPVDGQQDRAQLTHRRQASRHSRVQVTTTTAESCVLIILMQILYIYLNLTEMFVK